MLDRERAERDGDPENEAERERACAAACELDQFGAEADRGEGDADEERRHEADRAVPGGGDQAGTADQRRDEEPDDAPGDDLPPRERPLRERDGLRAELDEARDALREALTRAAAAEEVARERGANPAVGQSQLHACLSCGSSVVEQRPFWRRRRLSNSSKSRVGRNGGFIVATSPSMAAAKFSWRVASSMPVILSRLISRNTGAFGRRGGGTICAGLKIPKRCTRWIFVMRLDARKGGPGGARWRRTRSR